MDSTTTDPSGTELSARPRVSLMLAVQDLVGEGVDEALDRAVGYGVDGLSIAVAYHRARDVTPHGPQRVTMRQDGLHVMPDDDLFTGRLRPDVLSHEGPDLATIVAMAKDRGLDVNAWAVFCHSTTLGLRAPDLAHESCFGDRAAPADLCPAQPEVVAYAVDLARAAARLGVGSVLGESLHFGRFGHGYHHERSFVELGALDQYVLGLCFCSACRDAAATAGIDHEAAAHQARTAVAAVLDGGPASDAAVTLDHLSSYAGPALASYAGSRTGTVTALISQVAAAVAEEGSRLVPLEMTGGAKGYADGNPQGALAVDDTWHVGADVAAWTRAGGVSEIGVLGYARSATRISDDVTAYRRAAEPGGVRVILRPGRPDCDDADALGAHVQAAVEAGASAVELYHYGLYPYPVLDRIAPALAKLRG